MDGLEGGVTSTTEVVPDPNVVLVSSSLSLVFSLAMILLYCSNKNLRKGARGYLLMINICDFGSALFFFLSALDVPYVNSRIVRIIEVVLLSAP